VNAKQAKAAGIPVILADELHKVKFDHLEPHKIIALVCGEDGALACEAFAYEAMIEKTALAELKNAKTKAEFHNILDEFGIKMPNFRAIFKAHRKVRQDKKSRRKFLRRTEKHICKETRKQLKKDIKGILNIMQNEAVKNNPEVLKVYQDDLKQLQAQLDNLCLTKQ
jgi:hypothetical protein